MLYTMIIHYLQNPHTGELLKLRQFDQGDKEWLWERGIAGFYLHEFEQNSPEHTLFLLKNYERIK